MFNRTMQALAQHRYWWQFDKVFRNPNGCFIQLQEFNLLGIGARTQDEANWRLFFGCAFMLVQPAQVKLHLSFVAGLEGFQL